MKILALVSDAYGRHGGIAQYNRDILEALCGHQGIQRIVVIPRNVTDQTGPINAKISFEDRAASGLPGFLWVVLNVVLRERNWDVIYCGHIHLMPLVQLLGRLLGKPVVLQIHGIDAWERPIRWRGRHFENRADAVLSVSSLTLDRFLRWSSVSRERCLVIPNTYHEACWGMGPRPGHLLDRYGLSGKVSLLTLGRVERAKGFDEVLELLPALLRKIPNLAYIVAGDGPDRQRLEEKARTLGVLDLVVFTGLVPEQEKADLYRLADVHVMPSRGEGFGIVHLEAMACGLPVVASGKDGSREALRDGELGILVDPDDPMDIERGILEALDRGKRIPPGLDYFSFEKFTRSVRDLFDEIAIR